MINRKKTWIIWAVIWTAVVILAVFYYYGAIRVNARKTPSAYSVILYQNTGGEWETLLQGARQAAEDYGVMLNVVTMEQKATLEDQQELVEREAAGNDGILLAAVNSASTGSFLTSEKLQIPALTVETGFMEDNDKITNISADNYQMGRTLGEKILADLAESETEDPNILIVREYMERESVQERYQGVRDVLEASERPVKIRDIARAPGDFDLSLFIGVSMEGSGEYVVTLDKYCTEEAAMALKRKKAQTLQEDFVTNIYGIGNTAQTVNDLDNGYLQALVYQNEFNMGYEGIKALVEKENRGYFPEQLDIMYELVTRETLYDSQNEQLLFPYV